VTTSNQTSNPTTAVTDQGPVLPGRVVDIVHAAILATGHQPYSLTARFSRARFHTVDAQVSGDVSEPVARAVFAALGVTDAVLGHRYGQGYADLTGHVPALGVDLLIQVDLPPMPGIDPVDVAALIAGVDAARAAQDHATTEPTTTVATGVEGCPVTAPGHSSGQRSVRFAARFDSLCPACRQVLAEGSAAAWLDGAAVHDTCAQAGGVEVDER
jgi:hypothetical protein